MSLFNNDPKKWWEEEDYDWDDENFTEDEYDVDEYFSDDDYY